MWPKGGYPCDCAQLRCMGGGSGGDFSLLGGRSEPIRLHFGRKARMPLTHRFLTFSTLTPQIRHCYSRAAEEKPSTARPAGRSRHVRVSVVDGRKDA